ncbi:MAG: ThuA domain-containing protein [Planctomycetes bacterium]|nr:ThuA domain-containing protein [Planctomycetota bacterium]
MLAPLTLAFALSFGLPQATPVQEIKATSHVVSRAEAKRMNVMFIGDRGHHVPAVRLQDVYGPLLRAGFAIDWEEDLNVITRERLDDYDCVMMYANQSQHAVVPPTFFAALKGFVHDGGGFVALHCTSGCFMQSQEWLEFVGARFVSHGSGVFCQTVVDHEHELMDGWANFESWDETYVQQHFPADRVVLSMRDEEPWSWVRKAGKGRIYYNASGHDQRAWLQPGFLDLLKRAMDWTAGDAAAAARRAVAMPKFEYVKAEWAPNYEGRDPNPPMQVASTPQQAEAAMIVPAGFRAQVFAAEPMVVNPIAIAWDERGRCWVAESPDYPNTVNADGVGLDRVSILEDTDGDGRADKKTIFCDGLNLPTSILKVKGGILVTQAPDLLFLRDTDGDDKCDAKEVQFSGFGRWDTHAGPSNLRWGPDNYIWGSVGYAAFKRADGSQFGSGLWRWRPGMAEPEFMAQFTNNTWGLGFRDDGEVFGSTANGAPSFFMGAPKTVLAATAPNSPGAAPVHNTAVFHPALAQIRQGDFLGAYTAAAGHVFLTGSQIPTSWHNSALVCGPTGHLVGRFDSYADGSGYRTRDAFNFCVSVDDWFCPVQAEVGPDGAVWVADFSQYIILHNLPGNPERGLPKVEYGDGNAHLNPLRDTSHGRIFRIFREDAKPETKDLSGQNISALAKELSHPNRFWRNTSRRLIADDISGSKINSLTQSRSLGNLQAILGSLQTIEGRGDTLTEDERKFIDSIFDDALNHSPVEAQKLALDSLNLSKNAAGLLLSSGLLDSESADIRRHAYLAAARFPESQAIGVALAGRAMLEQTDDAWLPQVLSAAIAAHAKPFLAAATPLLPKEGGGELKNLFPNPGFELADPNNAEQPLAWRVRVYNGEAKHTWEDGIGRGGSKALAIHSQTGADTSWCTDIAVEPNTRYRLSAWIHAHGVTHPGGTHGALLNIHPRHVVTEYVQDESEWTQVSLEFQTGANERSVSINCLYGGWGKSTGEALYDDMELVSLGPASDLKSLIALAQKFAGDDAGPKVAEDHASLLKDGDVAKGREIFFNNQVVACNRCHAFEGQNGGVGPDLSDVGARLKREEILQSILDPNAAIAESWPAPMSAMPALRPFLNDQEMRDLISFLSQSGRE